MADEPKQKPVFTARSGKVKVAVWAKQYTNTETGEVTTRHNMSLTTGWKDESGAWHDSVVYLWPDQLLPAAALLGQVFTNYCMAFNQ